MMLLLAASESANPVNAQWIPLVTTLVVFGLSFLVLSKKVWLLRLFSPLKMTGTIGDGTMFCGDCPR